jgi:hypothetical protein
VLLAALLCGCPKPANDSSEKENAAGEPAAKPAFVPLDLQAKANQRLNVPPQARGQGNNLGDLPRGRQTLAGVPFVVGDSYVLLGSERFPAKVLLVSGIAVGRKAKRLHFLHAASFSGIHRKDGNGEKDGTAIGAYIVHYEDSSRAEAPIVYGEHVRDWWNWDGSKPVSRARVGWTGTNTYASRFGVTVRLYVSSWDNPQPEKTVTTIDVRSANSLAAPFCVAITADVR